MMSCENTKLICENTKLICENTKLICKNTKLICENTKLICKNTKLTCKNTKLICENTKLICENTKLICENSKYFLKVEVSLLGFHNSQRRAVETNISNRNFSPLNCLILEIISPAYRTNTDLCICVIISTSPTT